MSLVGSSGQIGNCGPAFHAPCPMRPSPTDDVQNPNFPSLCFLFSTPPAQQTLLNGSPIVSHGEGCFRAARRGDQAHGWAPDLDKLILSIMRDWESAEVTSLYLASCSASSHSTCIVCTFFIGSTCTIVFCAMLWCSVTRLNLRHQSLISDPVQFI